MQPPADNSSDAPALTAVRDLGELGAVEILGAHAVDLMTASAVKLGLYEDGDAQRDLADARILICGVAGLVDAVAPLLGNQHTLPLRQGVKSLQEAFRAQQDHPDAPGNGPGEKYTRPQPAGTAVPDRRDR
ncbi:MAG: DUF1844 domain-containing protein [Candidatus Nanopelagicales bacterium]|nr:DUF1844 domain-containing protein [Candidatus Nanopelagicales bacterium]